jgi:hypothetical protein
MGSGKLLKAAIAKYGRENFRKEILFVFDNKEQALLKEHEIVNQGLIADENCYNLKIGGEGGWDYINSKLREDIQYRQEIYEKQSRGLKEAYASGKLDHVKKATAERNKKMWFEGKLKGITDRTGFWSGRTLSDATKKKMSENNGNKLSENEVNTIIEKITNSEIDFTKFGWVGKVAELINRKPQKVNYLMKKYMNEFYETKCFKRK